MTNPSGAARFDPVPGALLYPSDGPPILVARTRQPDGAALLHKDGDGLRVDLVDLPAAGAPVSGSIGQRAQALDAVQAGPVTAAVPSDPPASILNVSARGPVAITPPIHFQGRVLAAINFGPRRLSARLFERRAQDGLWVPIGDDPLDLRVDDLAGDDRYGILAIAATGTDDDWPFVAFSADGATWQVSRLQRGQDAANALSDTPPLSSRMSIATVAFMEDGRGVAFTGGRVFVSLNQAERDAVLGAAKTAGAEAFDGMLVPEGVADMAAALKAAEEVRISVSGTLEQQRQFVETATASLDRQDSAARDVRVLSVELEKALRSADTVRQAGQIATRIAVIGVIIYLVQIVVNRYRYMQRLAGFYQARAQAFSMLADDGPGSSFLKNITIGEVTAMLSPDQIGFDKTAEPPTAHVVSLLQAAMRRG